MEPKRILLVFGMLDRGGAETLVMNIYKKIDRNKIQFDFIEHTQKKCDYEDEIKSLGGRIYKFPQYNVLNHFSYRKIWIDFLKNHPEYKIIHAHMTGSAAVFLPIAKRYGLYAISHSHIALSQKGLRQAIVNLYRYPLKRISDYMFACSDDAGVWMFGKNIKKCQNYSVLKNGVDTDIFKFSCDKRQTIRKELNIPKDAFVVGNVARFHIQKNHSLLIDVFKCVIDKNPNSYLLLVGDGDLREEIKEKAESLGISKNVIFTGVRSDVPELLSAMDVFCMTSFNEGLPVSLVEAQASGLHIIATDTISEEIKLTDLVDMCSLNDDAEYWANTVLKYSNEYERENTKSQLAQKGYDISTSAAWIQDFYLKHWE